MLRELKELLTTKIKRNKSFNAVPYARYLKRKKGQGLVEFVLILAFCAAIGWGANELGIPKTLNEAFNNTVELTLDDTKGQARAVTPVSPTLNPNTDHNTDPNANQNTDPNANPNTDPNTNPNNPVVGPVIDPQAEEENADKPKLADYVSKYKSYEHGMFDYVKALYTYCNQDSDEFWNEFKKNGVNIDENNLKNAVVNGILSKGTFNEFTDNDLWIWSVIKQNENWTLDRYDEVIRNFLADYKTVENYSADDLIARNAYFKAISTADGNQNWRVGWMLQNAENTSSLVDNNNYWGYLSIKKHFWANDEDITLTLAPKQESSGSSFDGKDWNTCKLIWNILAPYKALWDGYSEESKQNVKNKWIQEGKPLTEDFDQFFQAVVGIYPDWNPNNKTENEWQYQSQAHSAFSGLDVNRKPTSN